MQLGGGLHRFLFGLGVGFEAGLFTLLTGMPVAAAAVSAGSQSPSAVGEAASSGFMTGLIFGGLCGSAFGFLLS
jgi:hypothetical protein